MSETKNTNFRPEALAAQIRDTTQNTTKKGSSDALPPVHLWNPDFCGDIDMRIARDGRWYYMGSEISRIRMVKLFSTILRYDIDGDSDSGKYVLVTPVEKVGITVDDAPFLATSMIIEGQGEEQVISFKTNLEDTVTVDQDHPITVTFDKKTGEPSPYVLIRGNLKALISRATYYELVEYICEKNNQYGVMSHGEFFFMGEIE